MKRTLLEIAALSLLLTALDQLYRWLHPEVNLVRATLVGLTAFASLAALARLGARRIPVRRGALAIFASAFLSVLAIEAGALVSRSPASAAVHVAILATAYAALEARSRWRQREHLAGELGPDDAAVAVVDVVEPPVRGIRMTPTDLHPQPGRSASSFFAVASDRRARQSVADSHTERPC